MKGTVAFFHYHLRPGGFERVLVNLLSEMELSSGRPMLLLLRPEGAFLDELRNEVEVVELGTHRLRYAIPRLVRLVGRYNIEVLCTGHTQINLMALAAARWKRGLKVVIGEHTPLSLALEEMRRPRLSLALMRRLYPDACSVVVPVPELGTEVGRILGRPDLTFDVLHNPVLGRSVSAAVREEPPIDWPHSPVVAAAGRLIHAKGFDVLLWAIRRLESDPPVTLLLLGEGPEQGHLASLAERLGIAPRVRFCGLVGNPLPYFRRADVVVSASRRESFGNVLIEAMYCGTPVVATDCWAGSSFVVRDGAAGLLVPPDDPEALAKAIETVLWDGETASRLVSGGTNWCRNFSVERAVPAYARLLENALRS